ncbi:LytR C-terminal domain-containing protein [Georgenia sunbinii]|uniref:LytR C-terminal domain-containing protein n=1 Tax=Georgenia sunbinii TaxID=3117728 RepID=UPI002F26C2D8
MSEYPEDEFDIAGDERAPQGTHRAPRSPWRALLPYLLVIVLVPLLAWGAVGLLGGGNDGAGDDTPTAAEPTAEPTDVPDETDEPTDDPDPETTEPAEPEEPTTDDDGLGADVITSTSISVLNGASIAGVAGDAAADLTDAGFTAVSASDYGAGSPDVTTLYYRNADLAPTAEAVGEILGIDNLVELASATQNVEIAIVLRADFG